MVDQGHESMYSGWAEKEDGVGIRSGGNAGGIERFRTDRAVGDDFSDVRAGEMQLREVRGASAIAARQKNMLGMHVRSELGDQVSASTLAHASDAEAGLFGRSSGRLANCSYLQ